LVFQQPGKAGHPSPRDGGDCEELIADFGKAGINVGKLGADLQAEGAKAFVASWQDLLKAIHSKSKALK
jgi:transaldolase